MRVESSLSLACRFEYIVCTFLYTVYDAFSAIQSEHLDMLDDAMVENGEFLLEYVGQIHMTTVD